MEISLEVPGESLFIDVVVTPNPNPTGNPLSLGLLGRVIQRRCILETYRNAPTAEATNICMLKRTWYFQELRRRATRAKRALAKSEEPQLWIVTPTASENYLQEFGAKPNKVGPQESMGWPPDSTPGLSSFTIFRWNQKLSGFGFWFEDSFKPTQRKKSWPCPKTIPCALAHYNYYPTGKSSNESIQISNKQTGSLIWHSHKLI